MHLPVSIILSYLDRKCDSDTFNLSLIFGRYYLKLILSSYGENIYTWTTSSTKDKKAAYIIFAVIKVRLQNNIFIDMKRYSIGYWYVNWCVLNTGGYESTKRTNFYQVKLTTSVIISSILCQGEVFTWWVCIFLWFLQELNIFWS